MAFQHGVSTSEVPTSIFPVRQVDSALAFVVGVAPSGPVHMPTLVGDLQAFVQTFGGVPSSQVESEYSLSQFAQVLFKRYGVGPFVALNVLDPDKAEHQTAVAMGEAHTFTSQDQVDIGRGGLRSLVVMDSGEVTTYTEGVDYTADADLGIITRIDTGAIAALETVHVGYTYADPSKVAAADIEGGIDAGQDDKRLGLEAIDEVFPLLGKVATVIACPGYSHNASIASAMIAKAEGYFGGLFKAIALIDVDPAQATPAQAVAWKSAYDSAQAFVLWPHVTLGTETHPLSSHAAALMAKTDLDQGSSLPYVSPSNKTLNVTGPVRAITKPDADLLNEQGITTVFRFSGGFKLWGNRTAAFPSVTDTKDVFLPVRRMFVHVAHTLTLSVWQKVDAPRISD